MVALPPLPTNYKFAGAPFWRLTAKVIKPNIGIVHTERVEEIKDGFGHHRRSSSEAAIHDFVTSVTRVMVALPPLSIVNIHFVPWFPLDAYFPGGDPVKRLPLRSLP